MMRQIGLREALALALRLYARALALSTLSLSLTLALALASPSPSCSASVVRRSARAHTHDIYSHRNGVLRQPAAAFLLFFIWSSQM